MDKILHFEGGGLEVEHSSNGDSDSMYYALFAIIIIIGIAFEKFFTPFLIELNETYKNLLLTLNNNFVLILVLVFLLVPLVFLVYHRFLKRWFERKAEEERESERESRISAKEERRLERDENIDYAWKNKDDAKARELLREKYIEEKDFDALVNLEMPYYLIKKKKEEEDELDDDYKEEEPKEQISVNVDLDNPFYKRKNLNKHEIEFLLEEGYQETRYKSICTDKKENFIVKPRFNESLTHFIVIYDLAEYLLSKNVDYEIFMTRMPDIVMSFGRKKIALEVETGTVMSNMKKFREKLSLLEENYGEDWYFIVTNRNKVKKYKKYGKVIDLRYLKKKMNKIIEKH